MLSFHVSDHQRSIGTIAWIDVEVAVGSSSKAVELDRVFEEGGLVGCGRDELVGDTETRIRCFDSTLWTADSSRSGRLFHKATANRTAGRNDRSQTPASNTQIFEKSGKTER